MSYRRCFLWKEAHPGLEIHFLRAWLGRPNPDHPTLKRMGRHRVSAKFQAVMKGL